MTLDVGGQTLIRDNTATEHRRGLAGSGPATKTFVDAKISITPDATNEVGHPHTFTVTVQHNSGNGAGFAAATDGNVDVTLSHATGRPSRSTRRLAPPTTPAHGDNLNGAASPRSCSPRHRRQVTGNATVTLTVGGQTVVPRHGPGHGQRAAGPGGSAPATKTFVDAKIASRQRDQRGGPPAHLHGHRPAERGGRRLRAAPAGHVDVTLTNS